MARILVVDYSRSGNTHRVAEAIARSCDADLDEIRESRSRKGLLGWARSAREALGKRPAEIAPTAHDPAAYDLVVLGSPVWAGHVSSPLRRYLRDHSNELPDVALFVTEGGSGGRKALAEMAELAGHAPVATLELRQGDISDGLQAKLAGFVGQIQTTTARAAPGRA